MKNIIIIGLILQLWAGVAHGKTDAPSIMKQAEGAIQSGENKKATELYQKVIDLDPEYQEAYGALSILLLKQEKYQQAAQLLGRTTQRFPGYTDGWYNYAYSLRKIGQLKQALAAYQHFVTLMPKQADPHYGIGLTLKEMQQYSAAAASFRRYAQLENRADKKEWVKRAISLAVNLEGQARATSAKGSTDQAPVNLSTSSSTKPLLKVSPKNSPALLEIAPVSPKTPPKVPLHVSSKQGAAEFHPINSSPETPDPASQTPERRRAKAQKTNGDNLVRAGKPEQALVHYQQAITSDYSYTAAYNEYGTALFRLQRYEQAIRVFRVALRDNPDYLLGWYNLAYALRKAGRLPEAIAAYRKYISLKPSDPDPFFGLGLACKESGNNVGAISAFKSYIKLERRDQQARWIHKAQVEIANLEGKSPPTFSPNIPSVKEEAVPKSKAQLAREARQQAAEERKAKAAARRTELAEKRRLAREERLRAAEERKAKAAARRTELAEKRRLAQEERKAGQVSKKAKKKSVAIALFTPPPDVPPLADAIVGPPPPAITSQVPTKVTDKWRVQADTLARRDQCLQAIPLYQRVLSQDPFSTLALDGLAYCAFQVKQFDQGARRIGTGLRDNPEYGRGWLHLARLQQGGGHPDRAVGSYRKYLQKVANDPTGVFELARALKNIGLHQQAIDEYRRYLSLERRPNEDSRRVAAHQELKVLGSEQGDASGSGVKSNAAAETLLRTMGGGSETVAMRNTPEPSTGATKLTPAQLRAEKKRLAAEMSKQAAAARKAQAAVLRAEREETQRLAQEARKQAAAERKAKAVALRAEQKEARRLAQEARQRTAVERAEKRRLARLVQRQVKELAKDQPGQTLARAIAQDLTNTELPALEPGPIHSLLRPAPEAAQGLMDVADKQFAQKRYDVALGIYQQAAQLDPAASEPLYKAGVSAVALGQMHLAADLFAQVMQLDPKNGTALINLKMAKAAATEIPLDAVYLAEVTNKIRSQIENGSYVLAERKLDQLIEGQVSAQLHLLRAEARLALGKAEEAIQDGGRCLALDPGLLDAFRIMGYAQQQLNQPQKAIYYLRLYLARGGEDPTTKVKREQVKQTLAELGQM